MSTVVDTATLGLATRHQVAHFAPALVAWQAQHGRHHLPWQRTQDPYHVWLSEIMLQQTQVTTVLGYFERFLTALPNVAALAQAPQEQVMALWAGLGYYSRARNLHKCAQAVMSHFGGQFPSTAKQLEALPGIGPSTAAAIASFCFGQRISIYDGNVKRVLSRLLAFGGDLSSASANKLLHAQAQKLVVGVDGGGESMQRYTQGLMDLGATVCQQKKPSCERCPVAGLCAAHAAGETTRYPIKTKRLKRTSEHWYLLLLAKDDAVWLQQRSNTGIWGGLQAPLVFNELAVMSQWLQTQHIVSDMPMLEANELLNLAQPTTKHQLTHKELLLTPVVVHIASSVKQAKEPLAAYGNTQHKAHNLQELGAWVSKAQLATSALPAPIKKWLLQANWLIGG